ncbi:MAG: iron ABC transporter permease [Desulfohalobiaceae bacterium]|nr:iron ABC transporter permease [Desulfohalobiaceae bacterium]
MKKNSLSWQALPFGLAVLTGLPIAALALFWAEPDTQVWDHLLRTMFGELVLNTLVLVLGVGLLTLLLGVSLGWLTGGCRFPGSRFFSWALVMPLAVPTYVLAFIYLGLLDFSGPVQGVLSRVFASSGLFPVDVRGAPLVIVVFSLALYPYVFLLARTAFQNQGRKMVETARLLGHTRTRAFFKLCLPMARPWIAAGLMLVLMETLADFGAVSVLNYNTFTTAIYKAWYGFFSLNTAGQLSSILILAVFFCLFLEQTFRSRGRFTLMAGDRSMSAPIKLSGLKGWLAFGFAAFILLAAFGLPCLQLVLWSLERFQVELRAKYLEYALNTVMLGLTAGLIISVASTGLAYAKRLMPGTGTLLWIRIATLGYALPGTVLAVGVFVVAGWLDRVINWGARSLLALDIGSVLQGSLGLMLAAYCIRFMTLGFGAVDSSTQKVSPGLDDAARLSGLTGWRLIRRIHLPLIKSGLLSGLILVVIDVMKEMPITLMMRPFGWDTLAVKIYELTSEGQWERAAVPALVLVFVGCISVAVLTARQSKTEGER